MTVATFGGRAGATYGTTSGAVLTSAFATTNFGDGTGTAVGTCADIYLFRPDWSTFPSGVTITDATMTINITSGGSGGSTVPFRRVLRTWIFDQTTYNVYTTGNNWGTAGAENTSTDRASSNSGTITYAGGFATGDIVSSSNTTLIADCQGRVDGSITDLSWLFDLEGLGIAMATSVNTTAANRPLLTVTYSAASTAGTTAASRGAGLGNMGTGLTRAVLSAGLGNTG